MNEIYKIVSALDSWQDESQLEILRRLTGRTDGTYEELHVQVYGKISPFYVEDSLIVKILHLIKKLIR